VRTAHAASIDVSKLASIHVPVRSSASPNPEAPYVPPLAEDMDLRTDVGEYRVFRDGVAAEIINDVSDLWRDDFVAFVLGCSFSFEQQLMDAGVPLRHIIEGSVSPMYITNISTAPSGPFDRQ
jgi:uncharacterized protein YcsI (UPF0317 family)